MRYVFFFLTDGEKQPRITVCMRITKQGNFNSMVSIGTMICGPTEIPEVEFGMKGAMKRADRMWDRYRTLFGATKMIQSDDAFESLHRCGYPSIKNGQWVGHKCLNASAQHIINDSQIFWPQVFKDALLKANQHPEFEYVVCLPKNWGYSHDFASAVGYAKSKFEESFGWKPLPKFDEKSCKFPKTKDKDLTELLVRLHFLEEKIKMALL